MNAPTYPIRILQPKFWWWGHVTNLTGRHVRGSQSRIYDRPEDLSTKCSIGSMIQSDPIVMFDSRY